MIDVWLGEQDSERLGKLATKLHLSPGEVIVKLVQRADPDYDLDGTAALTCASCGLTFFGRLPKRGTRHYCEDCRASGRASTDRVRRWRRQRRQAEMDGEA
jgi:hypothetical protein